MTRAPMPALFIFLLGAGLAFSARGENIAIKLSPAAQRFGGRVAALVAASNSGDEEARGLSVSAGFLGGGLQASPPCVLPPGASTNVVLDLGAAPTADGVHAIVVKARYTDPLGYPSTVVRPLLFPEQTGGEPAPVSLLMRTKDIARHGRVLVELRSRQPEARSAVLTLVLPDEIGCDAPRRTVQIEPGRPTVCTFDITNLHGLPGSVYRLYAVAEFMAPGGLARAAMTYSAVRVKHHVNLLQQHRTVCLGIAALCLAVFIARQFGRRGSPLSMSLSHLAAATAIPAWTSAAVLAALLWFTLDHIPLPLLLADTTLGGGDTVAHNYMASHVAGTLLRGGRIVSWAAGWWCGFPLFQFYFPLPYVVAALLDVALPFNVALKLVTVAGILLLPVCAWQSARWLRLASPGPALVAVASLLLLFDTTHTMWGVNIYSTFAGMIANSVSFPIMLLLIGSAARDTDEGRFRIRTALLTAALIASHFFTSIVAALCLGVLPLLRPRAGFRRAVVVLLQEGGLGVLLMAWWLVPLLAKREFAVDFGTNWDVRLPGGLPAVAKALSPLALLALALAPWRGARFAVVMAWMGAWSAALFWFGFRLSPVFVNIRLWPFVTFALLALAAAGLGAVLQGRRSAAWALGGMVLLALSFGIGQPNQVRFWASWNYSGLERKPRWPVIERLVLPLDGTPGRLANDLHPENNSLGSPRVFECVPHLVRKPVLEGGIVNSAAGSLYSYYVQGETSANCAGFPPIVRPTTFNITNATRHLELFNVKHFIARWEKTKAGLDAMPGWRRLGEVDAWRLYELTTHAGRYVTVLDEPPAAVRTAHWKEMGLEWIYRIEALGQPFVLLPPGEPADGFPVVLDEQEFLQHLGRLATPPAPGAAVAWTTNSAPVETETVSDDRIAFRTRAVGKPHVIKCTYYPNWKVRGADRVYMLTPCFMLVYPRQPEIELYWGRTLPDNAGHALTLLGAALLGAAAWRVLRGARAADGEPQVVRPRFHS